jgi:hypothetical protein
MPEITARFWLNLETDYQLSKALIKRRSEKLGGAGGDRTLYLFNAIEALSQMSYSPP